MSLEFGTGRTFFRADFVITFTMSAVYRFVSSCRGDVLNFPRFQFALWWTSVQSAARRFVMARGVTTGGRLAPGRFS